MENTEEKSQEEILEKISREEALKYLNPETISVLLRNSIPEPKKSFRDSIIATFTRGSSDKASQALNKLGQSVPFQVQLSNAYLSNKDLVAAEKKLFKIVSAIELNKDTLLKTENLDAAEEELSQIISAIDETSIQILETQAVTRSLKEDNRQELIALEGVISRL